MLADLFLAQKLYAGGDADGSEAQCMALLQSDGTVGDAYLLLARIRHQRRDYSGARKLLELAETNGAAGAETHYLAGLGHYARNQMTAARQAFENVIAIDPENQNTHWNLGLIEGKTGNTAEAAVRFIRCLEIQPRDDVARHNLFDALHGVDWDAAGIVLHLDGIRRHLEAGFGDTDFDMKRHLPAAAAAIRSGRHFRRAMAAFSAPPAAAQETGLATRSWFRGLLGDPLLRRVLRFDIIALAEFEFLLTNMRRALLMAALPAEPAAKNLPLDFCMALAHQAYLTEYAYAVSEHESHVLDEARTRRPADAVQIAILASYAPLPGWMGMAPEPERLNGAGLGPLVRQQILEPAAEASLQPAIPTLAPVRHGTSAQVKSQYEHNPFPRWSHLRRPKPATVGATLEFLFPHFKAPEKLLAPCAILIAGCGIGHQPIVEALRYPASAVTAFDLSRASLAYGMRMAEQMGAGNIEYLKADILDLDRMDQMFDVVECTGVLHHMADPMAGWSALTAKLAPGGVMKIGLYSALARRTVAQVRQWIAQQGLTPSPQNIRQARQHILALPEDHPHRSVTEFSDFIRSTAPVIFCSMCRNWSSASPKSRQRWSGSGSASSACTRPTTVSRPSSGACFRAMRR